MKERLYRAFWDDGHDTGEFEFYSKHRAGSKANIEDAYTYISRNYGSSAYRRMKITSTYLV
jgi:hypothetical protein